MVATQPPSLQIALFKWSHPLRIWGWILTLTQISWHKWNLLKQLKIC
jgi:hypothetical protein